MCNVFQVPILRLSTMFYEPFFEKFQRAAPLCDKLLVEHQKHSQHTYHL